MILLLILCHLGFAIKCLEGDQKKSQKVKANKMQDLECPGNQCGRIWNKKTKKLTLQCGAETCTGLNLDEIKLPTISFGRRKRAPGCPNKCQKKVVDSYVSATKKSATMQHILCHNTLPLLLLPFYPSRLASSFREYDHHMEQDHREHAKH